MSDDLIRRQAAIDVLAEMQGRCTTKAALIQNSKIWQQIKDLPSAEPKWIPVTERLPGEEDYHDFWEFPDGAVLWCKDTGEIGIGWYYKLSNNWGDLWDNAVRNIVAWMPLPEPWKGEDDG